MRRVSVVRGYVGMVFGSLAHRYTCVLVVCGVIVIALPISVISANFKKLFFENEKQKKEGLGMVTQPGAQVR